MKALSVMLLFLTLAGVAAAQTADEAPGVSVVEKSWRREVRNPAMEDDPFRANDAHNDWLLAQREVQRQNAMRRKSNQEALPPTLPRAAGGSDFAGQIVYYLYKAKFSNTGEKAIQGLEWEYAFVDPGTQAEVGRHSYIHKVKLRPGKSVELMGLSDAPPARVVDVKDSKKSAQEMRNKYAERIRVTRILYADGTTWERPAN
ncbi:MAG TPA: hypothetical protein VGX48_16395 [Pyrinomonadaceae bacterium]|jgi:hypothetical protein|nr:hypothetical protein [Pyrinomonadaceae bacterium]